MFRVFEAERVDQKGLIVVKEGKKEFAYNDKDIQGVIEFPDGGCCIAVFAMMFHVPYTTKEIAKWLNSEELCLADFCSSSV